MSLIPYRRPERNLGRLHEDFDDMISRFFGDWNAPFARGGWVPALDVAVKDDAVIVEAELPGLKPEDIDISVQGNTLLITGEKRSEQEENRENYYHVERTWGSFRRSVALPTEVDVDRIEARHENGVLTIRMPKSERAKARRIQIK